MITFILWILFGLFCAMILSLTVLLAMVARLLYLAMRGR